MAESNYGTFAYLYLLPVTTLVMNIKDFIPPVILKLRNRITKREGENALEVEYDSYEAAQAKCSKGDYQDIELCNMIADKTIRYRDALLQQSHTLNSSNVFLLAALDHTRFTHYLDAMTVMDFGGACGAHYFEMRRFLPEAFSLKWIVVETPRMVTAAKKKKLETNELLFVDHLDGLPPIDFIYSSGALQYTSDPYGILANLLSLGAYSILFNRMMLNENDREFITIQTSLLSANGPGPMPGQYTDKVISFPHTTLSFNKFNSVILNAYQMAWLFKDDTGSYKIGDEPIIGRGLFYTAMRSVK